MISCNKKLKSAAKGFLCGMLLYLFMIFMTGHFTFFRLSEIPDVSFETDSHTE